MNKPKKIEEKSAGQGHDKIVKIVMDWNSWYVDRFLNKDRKDADVGFG
jgi:hypothetical protein